MNYLPYRMGKLAAVAALAVIALALIVVAGRVAPASAAPLPQTATTPAVPAANVSIVAVPGNAASKVAITTTIKMMTDTKVGPKNTTVALFTSGLQNVPISVPVKLQATPADPKFTGKVTWRLQLPTGSKAKLNATDKPQVEFTPDVVGYYMVSAQYATADGKTTGSRIVAMSFCEPRSW